MSERGGYASYLDISAWFLLFSSLLETQKIRGKDLLLTVVAETVAVPSPELI